MTDPFFVIDMYIMKSNVLNDQAFHVFLIIAETLEKWQNPETEEGKFVLTEHYNWAAELKAQNKLIMAGPTDFELTSTKRINPIGHTTGCIMLNVLSREDAITLAEKDPFHVYGYRKNVVHSFKITMTEKSVFETLKKIKNQT